MIQSASELALPAPNASDLAATFAAMDDDSLIELAGDAQAVLDRERAEYEERTARDRAVVAAAQAAILQRIIDAGGTALPHDRYDVHAEWKEKIERDEQFLEAGLRPLVPAEELAKAIYYTQPAPVLKADKTKLDALARKYGGEIARIVENGFRRVLSQPHLVIHLKESALKDVTPTSALEANA